jgi:hypothetical protein
MEGTDNIDWKSKNIAKISNEVFNINDEIEEKESRRKIEPWLTSIFQSDHLSLLVGSGLTTAVTSVAGSNSQGMERINFKTYKGEIRKWADKQASTMDRRKANFEDDLRTAMDLLEGLKIIKDEKTKDLETDINSELGEFIGNILKGEKDFIKKDDQNSINYLKSFLISFASRTATRDRLNIFTTNYDRFIEYGCDLAGILILDRFIGKIKPEFRTTRLELDYHYNPPGIRGEPRYVEGVVRLTKLHGSIDWCFEKRNIQKLPIAFGAHKLDDEILKSPLDCAVIYPNSLKCLETAFYPYSELFRDFSSTICRPNSVVVTYGYGFGDSHINRILQDMLTIPSTHLVIISYDESSDRIQKFYEYSNKAQITLLMGNHFGDLKELVDNYLPKAAIDRITQRMQNILERRGKQGFSQLNKMNGEKKDET